jgi:hypothetical protein
VYSSDLTEYNHRHIYCHKVLFHPQHIGLPTGGSGQGEKSLSGPQAGADRLKIFTPNGKDWLLVAVWLWLGMKRVNLYKRQIMIIPENTKTYATYPESEPPSGPGAPVMCTGFPPFVGTDNMCLWAQAHSRERPRRKHQSCSLDGRNEGWDVHHDISHSPPTTN